MSIAILLQDRGGISCFQGSFLYIPSVSGGQGNFGECLCWIDHSICTGKRTSAQRKNGVFQASWFDVSFGNTHKLWPRGYNFWNEKLCGPCHATKHVGSGNEDIVPQCRYQSGEHQHQSLPEIKFQEIVVRVSHIQSSHRSMLRKHVADWVESLTIGLDSPSSWTVPMAASCPSHNQQYLCTKHYRVSFRHASLCMSENSSQDSKNRPQDAICPQDELRNVCVIYGLCCSSCRQIASCGLILRHEW